MKKNMGKTDSLIRLVVAVLIAVLFFADIITGTLGIILLIVAGILLITSFVKVCPLYLLFGIRTCPKE